MSIEKFCEKLNIKGLVNYGESDKYLSVHHNGIQYVYNKLTDTLLVKSEKEFYTVENYTLS